MKNDMEGCVHGSLCLKENRGGSHGSRGVDTVAMKAVTMNAVAMDTVAVNV